jgi:chorismate mutase/prephenate dehydratase
MDSIEKLRKKIDQIDDCILDCLVRRAGVAKDIGRAKSKSGDGVYSSTREREILDRLSSRKLQPLAPEDIEAIFGEVFNACRNVQRRLRISYFGPEATYTHQVALKHFGQSAEMIPQKFISDVFSDVQKGRADYGVVPIENSTEGVVNHTLDMFVHSDLSICAEREEPISHFLLSTSGQIKKIKRLYSHPQPLGQCRRWLESHLPSVEIHEAASTADAASQASLDASAAAIASELAGKLYHLKAVARGIEDYEENYTRFLIIGKHSPKPSGKDKTSLLLSIKDKVGALNDILAVFKNHGINLTKIESRPTKKKAWEYLFFVDLLGHASELRVQKAMEELKKSCQSLKVLGSYPRGE